MKTSTPRTHWLDIAEMTAIAGSLGGSIASVFLKPLLWVTIPLSVSAGLAIVNHQRLKRQIQSEREAVASLIEENHGRITKLKQQSEKQHWENQVEFTQLKQTNDKVSEKLEELDTDQKAKLERATQELQTLQVSMTKLDELTSKLEEEQNATRKLAGELKAIEKFTQMIAHNPNSVQAYYNRGSAYQRSGNIERAIQDFSQTIALQEDHAKAHHKRGQLYLEIDRPQEAIIDFRRASQCYISQGNLDKYRETRDLSLKIHFDRTKTNESQTEEEAKPKSVSVPVNGLFG